MPNKKEVCWKCKEVKAGVTLCSDDRLCPDSYQENECGLAAIRASASIAPVTVTKSVTVPAVGVSNASLKRAARAATIQERSREPGSCQTLASKSKNSIDKKCKSTVSATTDVEVNTNSPDGAPKADHL
jgi:hypothetical protein